MEVKNLKFHKCYLMSINDFPLKARYEGEASVFSKTEDKTEYVFTFYSFNDDEFFQKYLDKKDVSRLVQEIPFGYNSACGGVSGLKRWLSSLINLLNPPVRGRRTLETALLNKEDERKKYIYQEYS